MVVDGEVVGNIFLHRVGDNWDPIKDRNSRAQPDIGFLFRRYTNSLPIQQYNTKIVVRAAIDTSI